MGRLDKVSTGNGLRRSRVTNKTRLKVVDGDVDDAELVILEEDADKNKVLDTAGVEHEDAKEEHLVKVLAAAARRIGSSRATKASDDTGSASIPIPDATGIADDYAERYPTDQWIDPYAFVKASDTVEESVEGALLGGFSYDMDERDVEWLEKNNSFARGEGSSTSPTSARAPAVRNAKARGKETADRPSFVITETELELTMGLFEKFTDEKCPYLHLDVKGLPPLSDYEPLFAAPLLPSIFSNFQVPTYCRDPSHLVRLARTIYPHWRDRKIQRQGHKIIPQLNFDETNDGDPYVCFRRRDAKSVRKTRRSDNTPADKVSRLRSELLNAKDLATSVLSREVKKLELGKDSRVVLEARLRLVELKRKYPHLASAQDDNLMVDPERVFVKRPKVGETGVSLKIPRRSKESTEVASPFPAGSLEDAPNPHERAAFYQKEIDRLIEMKKNTSWDDFIDLPVGLPSGPPSSSLFRNPLEPSRTKDPPRLGYPGPPLTTRSATSFRVRVGRGGRVHVDRRASSRRHPLGPPPSIPIMSSEIGIGFLSHRPKRAKPDSRMETDSSEEDGPENIRQLDERWRFDDDSAVADEEQRIVIDDFDFRYLRSRLSLFTENDLQDLAIDESHVTRAENYSATRQYPGLRALHVARQQFLAQRAEAQAQALAAAAVAPQPSVLRPNATSQPAPTPVQTAVTQPVNGPSVTQMPQSQPQSVQGTLQSYVSQSHANAIQAAQAQAKRLPPHPTAMGGPSGSLSNGPIQHGANGIGPQGPSASSPPVPNGSTLSSVTSFNGTLDAKGASGSANGSQASPPQFPASDGNPTPAHSNSPRPKSQPQVPMALPQVGGFPGAIPYNAYAAANGNGVNGGNVSYMPVNNGQQVPAHAYALQMASLKANPNPSFMNGNQQQPSIQSSMANGVRGGMMSPPQAVGQPGTFHQGIQMPSGASVPMNMSSTNMALKLPQSRQLQWTRHNSNGEVSSTAPTGMSTTGPNPSASPIQHHMSPPNGGGRASPVRMPNGSVPGRSSPMNPRQQAPQAVQGSPMSDIHSTPQHRTTPSPLSVVSSDVSMMQHSPHLSMRSPANQHQIIGNAPSS